MREALLAGDWVGVTETMRGHTRIVNVSRRSDDAANGYAGGKGSRKRAGRRQGCGAGGGGCIAFFCAEGKRRDGESALTKKRASRSGLED